MYSNRIPFNATGQKLEWKTCMKNLPFDSENSVMHDYERQFVKFPWIPNKCHYKMSSIIVQNKLKTIGKSYGITVNLSIR